MTILAWLTGLGLERYAPAFDAAEVDLDALPHLTEDDLKELGLPLGPRRKLLASLPDLQTELAAVSSSPLELSSPERRHITVMFADLADSTQLSTRIDPEAMSGLLEAYKAVAAQEIVHSAGMVAKYLGDGIMAYFGWPQAREDAAQCAVRCAMEIVERVKALRTHEGEAVSCRIGIATGLVVVGGVTGSGSAKEDTIAGEVLNLAARLQGLAGLGGVVICDATHRLVGQLFDCEDLGEYELKGFDRHVKAWGPIREAAHTRRLASAHATRTPLIGREQELGMLSDRWAKACRGEGRAVLLLGEAGMGKSRLVQALHSQILDTPHGFVVWQCSAFHSGKALYPVIEHLKSVAEIADIDPPRVRLEKLKALLTTAGMPIDEVLPLFAGLLAIPAEAGYAPTDLPPAQRRALTIAALVDWIGQIAAAKPLLLLLEDAHWIDSTTLDLIGRLVSSISRLPIVALVTSRPGFSPPWAGGAQASVIGLDRLSDTQAGELIRGFAAQVAPTEAMISQVISKSDGNPLFLEELGLATLQTRRSAASAVPDTLQGSLMARLDQLGEAKRVAQTCAVLGRRFALPLLARMSDLDGEALERQLATLIASDIVYPLGRAQDARYEFKHALVRDAAYASLLLSRRRELHEQAARALERDFADVALTEPELLAHHFVEANLPAEAALYWEKAGDQAAAAVAFTEAIAGYGHALEQTERTPRNAERDHRELALLLKLGPARIIISGPQNPEVRSIYTRAEALARSLDESDSQFQAVWGLWMNANIGRDLDVAVGRAQQLIQMSDRSGNGAYQLEALHCRWSSAYFRGEYTLACTDTEKGSQLYDRAEHHSLHVKFGGHDPGVCACACNGGAKAAMGRFRGGVAMIAEAVALAESLDHPHSICHALQNGVVAAALSRDLPMLAQRGDRLLNLAAKYNFPPMLGLARYFMLWGEVQGGNTARLSQMRTDFPGTFALVPFPLLIAGLLADQLVRNGDVSDALAVTDQALGIIRPRDVGLYLPEIHRLRGESLAALGDPAAASAEFARAREVARRQSSALFEVRALASAIRLEDDGSQTRVELASSLKATLADVDAGADWPDHAEAAALLS